MSWLIFLGNLAKILFLDSHAKNLQVRTYLDVFLVSTMARSWQDLPRFIMFLIKMYQVSIHWDIKDSCYSKNPFKRFIVFLMYSAKFD